MTLNSDLNALFEKFKTEAAAVVRKHTRSHPAEPTFAASVKVFFTGDRDGNTYAVCHPTNTFKKVKRSDGRRERAQMWRYTYENATGTSGTRSWVGMLKTLDGHGRTASRVEVYRAWGMERIDL